MTRIEIRIEFLQDQATRAERIAGSVLDPLTIDRLRLYAAECRIELDCLRARDEDRSTPVRAARKA